MVRRKTGISQEKYYAKIIDFLNKYRKETYEIKYALTVKQFDAFITEALGVANPRAVRKRLCDMGYKIETRDIIVYHGKGPNKIV
jgi:hypothetical protein